MEREMDLRRHKKQSPSAALSKQEYQIPGQLLLWRGQARPSQQRRHGRAHRRDEGRQRAGLSDRRRPPHSRSPASSTIAALTSTRSSKRTAKAAHLATRRSRICCSWGICRQNPSFPILTISCAEPESCPEGFTEGMIMRHPSRDIMNDLARSVLLLVLLRRKSRRYFGGEPAHAVHQAHRLVPGDRCKRLRSEPPLF